jgi:hypothetical protein
MILDDPRVQLTSWSASSLRLNRSVLGSGFRQRYKESLSSVFRWHRRHIVGHPVRGYRDAVVQCSCYRIVIGGNPANDAVTHFCCQLAQVLQDRPTNASATRAHVYVQVVEVESFRPVEGSDERAYVRQAESDVVIVHGQEASERIIRAEESRPQLIDMLSRGRLLIEVHVAQIKLKPSSSVRLT